VGDLAGLAAGLPDRRVKVHQDGPVEADTGRRDQRDDPVVHTGPSLDPLDVEGEPVRLDPFDDPRHYGTS
jgi:hypothetical protein